MTEALGLDPATIVELSASLNPCAVDIEQLAGGHLDSLRAYPDAGAATAELAAALEVEADRVLLTNGGSEAIALVGDIVGGEVHEPEFGLYPRRGGPLWRSDPHTPTGRLQPPTATAGVWDEAFYPLATGRWTAGRRAITVGSLTKVFACPGLRLGYVIADEADRFRKSQPLWSVNSLAVAMLPQLLATAELEAWRDEIATRRAQLCDLMAAHGLIAQAADAPWILVERADLRARLAPHGVVVRDCSSFGLAGHARIAVPDDRGFERLEQALPRI